MLARRAVKHRKGRGNEGVGQLSPEAVIVFSNICEMVWMTRPLPHPSRITHIQVRSRAGPGWVVTRVREGGRGRGPALLSISPGYIEKQCLMVLL